LGEEHREQQAALLPLLPGRSRQMLTRYNHAASSPFPTESDGIGIKKEEVM
jgi:hypothetical protein